MTVITIDKSDVHARCQVERSKVKVTDENIFFDFDQNWAFPGNKFSLNLPMATDDAQSLK